MRRYGDNHHTHLLTAWKNHTIICDMKMGVVSDTHSNLDYLRKAIRSLLNQNVDTFVHLGDDYEDAESFDEFSIGTVMKVPGVYDPEYSDRKIPNRLIRDFLGWRVMMSHTPVSHLNDIPDDLKPEDLSARKEIDILLHGHTHIPGITKEKGILRINPGHLKREDNKGYFASFGILEFTEQKVVAKIFDFMTKKQIHSQELNRNDTVDRDILKRNVLT